MSAATPYQSQITNHLSLFILHVDFLLSAIRLHPELAIYLAISLGFLIGRIRIAGFTLGSVTGVLITALVVGQLDIAAADALEAKSASEEALTSDNVVNSDGAKSSTGEDAFGPAAAPSMEQVASCEDAWEQAVDQAAADLRRAAADQANPRSSEEAGADIDDAAPAATPADQSLTDAGGLDQTDPGTPSPVVDEQQQAVKPAVDKRA